MHIIFMGTPAFALPALRTLQQSRHTVGAVVTRPDTPKGRGQKVLPTPVKAFALENNIPCLSPASLKDTNFQNEIRSFPADIYVVVAFRILPESLFTIPPQGTINLHASLLPYYRGAAPIQRALMAGEIATGVTTFFIESGIDTGNILLQEKIDILPDQTAGELADILAEAGADLLSKTIEHLNADTLVSFPQLAGEYPTAPKISDDEGLIQWNQPIQTVHNFIRGLSPDPGAYTLVNNKVVKILRSRIAQTSRQPGNTTPGTTLSCSPRKPFYIHCPDGVLEILDIQPEGKRVMTAKEFLAGARLQSEFAFTQMKAL